MIYSGEYDEKLWDLSLICVTNKWNEMCRREDKLISRIGERRGGAKASQNQMSGFNVYPGFVLCEKTGSFFPTMSVHMIYFYVDLCGDEI